jgi:predicted transcriptional regulator
MKNKNQQIMVRLTDEDKEALDSLAIKLDVPVSQIARQAVREKITELTKSEKAKEAEVVSA